MRLRTPKAMMKRCRKANRWCLRKSRGAEQELAVRVEKRNSVREPTGPEERISPKVTEGSAWSTGGGKTGALVEGRPRRRKRSGLENFILLHVERRRYCFG